MIQSKSQNLNWHVIYTRPKFEKKIFSKLRENNIETFLPLHKVMRQWSDRKKRVEVPLFPNYLFVNIAPKNRWHVLSVEGVVRFLQFEAKPAIVPEKDMETIRKSVLGNPEVSNQRFNNGDHVIIFRGPLRGLEGVLVNTNGRRRLAVRVDVIDKSILVNVSPADLQKNCLPAHDNQSNGRETLKSSTPYSVNGF